MVRVRREREASAGRLLRVRSAAAEERERAAASRAVSEAEALSQMKTGAELALVRDEIEALESDAAAAAGGQKLERTSSAQGLLAKCRAHLRAGRELEGIAYDDSTKRAAAPSAATSARNIAPLCSAPLPTSAPADRSIVL